MFAEASSAADLCCRLLMQRTLLREQQHLSRKSRVVTLRKAAPPPAAASSHPTSPAAAAGGARLAAAAPEGPGVRSDPAVPAFPSAAEDGGKLDGGGEAAERGRPPTEADVLSPVDAFDVSFSSSCSSSHSEPDSAGSSFSSDSSGSTSTEGTAASPTTATLVVTSAASAPPEASVSPELVDRFRTVLIELLLERCRSSSWDPRYPMLGNAYRAVSRLSPCCSMDQILLRAAEEAGLDADVLRECLPRDFVIWIDPGTVSYRVGDHGATMTLMDQGRVIPPTTTPPSAMAIAAGVHAPSSAQPSRLQLPLLRGAPAISGFPISAGSRSHPKPLAINPYAVPRCATSGQTGLPPQQLGGWPAPQATFRFSEQAPPATIRQQQQQQQRQPAKNAQAAPLFSGFQQPPAAVPPQLMPVHRVHLGLAHPRTHHGGIFVQPDSASVKISSPPASPPQTVSKRPAYIMAN